MKYRPEIDGLRAIAVIPVVLYHFGISSFSGGFVGVDVFFVISGYLITSLIIEDIGQRRFSILDFYRRRIRRIIPALLVVLCFCIPPAWYLMNPGQVEDFHKSLVSVSFFVSNFYFAGEADYFGAAADTKPLLHTWSLAVEEQFYLFFPLLLVATAAWGRSKQLNLIIIICIVSFVLSEYLSFRKPEENFFFSPSRTWELGIGSVCAYLLANDKCRKSDLLSLFGLILIGLSFFVIGPDTRFPSAYALLPTIGAALIILFCHSGASTEWLLSGKPLVAVGLISYSLYLWHYPLFVFASMYFDAIDERHVVVLLLMSFALSAATWKFVELPFRNRQARGLYSLNSLIRVSVSMTLVFVVLHFANDALGLQKRVYVARLTPIEKHAFELIRKLPGRDYNRSLPDDGACRFGVEEIDTAFISRFEDCAKKHNKAIVLLGDSHGRNIFNMQFMHSDHPFLVGIVKGGCQIHRNKPNCPYNKIGDFVIRYQSSIAHFFYHQSGSRLIDDEDGKPDSDKAFLENGNYSINTKNIGIVSDLLSRVGETVATTWLGPFVEPRIEVKNPEILAGQNFRIATRMFEIFHQLDEAIIKVAEQQSVYRYQPIQPVLKLEESSLVVDDCLTYRDRDHFSRCGELLFGEPVAVLMQAHRQ